MASTSPRTSDVAGNVMGRGRKDDVARAAPAQLVRLTIDVDYHDRWLYNARIEQAESRAMVRITAEVDTTVGATHSRPPASLLIEALAGTRELEGELSRGGWTSPRRTQELERAIEELHAELRRCR